MKKLSILLIAVMVVFATSCTKNQDEQNTQDNQTEMAMRTSSSYQNTLEVAEASVPMDLEDIDPAIVEFIDTYFPEAEIINCCQSDNGYRVRLADGTKVHFDLEFNWTKVMCDHSTVYTSVPAELIPAQIADYVAAEYPEQVVVTIHKTCEEGWMIKLDSHEAIVFDAEFNVIEGGCNGGGNGHGNGGNGGGCNGGGHGCDTINGGHGCDTINGGGNGGGGGHHGGGHHGGH
jgi:hypothetical protein